MSTCTCSPAPATGDLNHHLACPATRPETDAPPIADVLAQCDAAYAKRLEHPSPATLREWALELEGVGRDLLRTAADQWGNDRCLAQNYPRLRAELARVQRENADLEESLAEKRRLTRELDVALSGAEGAAQQASLCDLIGPAERMRAELARLQAVETMHAFCHLASPGDPTGVRRGLIEQANEKLRAELARVQQQRDEAYQHDEGVCAEVSDLHRRLTEKEAELARKDAALQAVAYQRILRGKDVPCWCILPADIFHCVESPRCKQARAALGGTHG